MRQHARPPWPGPRPGLKRLPRSGGRCPPRRRIIDTALPRLHRHPENDAPDMAVPRSGTQRAGSADDRPLQAVMAGCRYSLVPFAMTLLLQGRVKPAARKDRAIRARPALRG
ncbi:hypothetical protein SFOMI_4540 [Sphingobium fuliginis]|uniref:Uncharacterized protein n=1 Tax=Sphingobium fuliginis (strain ATCC 27551) TaxID=336203 RepID=A0A292ZGW9_SPHSA|nr:hypothetical protein SFOMI_4540 [Sphingobium fuliginis]